MELEEMVDAVQAIQEWCQHHSCDNCPFEEYDDWDNCMFLNEDYGKIPLDWEIKSLKERANSYLRKERSRKENVETDENQK